MIPRHESQVNNGKGFEVNKTHSCPICNSNDWCYIYQDGNVCCGRSDIAPSGWKVIGKSGDDRNIFALIQDRDTYKAREFKKVLPSVQPKRKAFKAAPLPDKVILAKGSMPKSERKEHTDLKLGECYLTIYDYGNGKAVYRYESLNGEPLPGKKSNKICLPFCDGKFEKGDDIWTAYRLNEAFRALEECPESNTVIAGEGEKVVDCFWGDLGLAAITVPGAGWNEENIRPVIEALKARNANLAYNPDNDAEGQRKAEKLAKICADVGLPFIQINPTDIDTECQNKDDIVNIFTRMGKEETLAKIEAQINKVLADYQNRIDDVVGEEKREKKPPADIIAREICEDYRDKLAFNNETKVWMRYEADFPGIWSPESDEFMESIVSKILDSKGLSGYGNRSYLTNIFKKMRDELIERKWDELPSSEYLPFTNGILNVRTGELLPHSPGYKLTWQLPREHNSLASDWSKIDDFLNHLANRNEKLKHLLICFCVAVLKGRSDLQKFLHLIGMGGTGKGTMARLITALIGAENVLTTTIDDWCGNRFETANAYGKKLVLFADEDKQTGKLGKFLSLTGEDWIRAEEKGKKAYSYRYKGMVVVCSNLPIFVGDATSRVKRRAITVPCNNVVAPNRRRNLEQEFEPQLAAFTNYLLSISDDEVTRVLLGLENIPEVALEFWRNRIRVDSIAAWLNDYVIADPLAKTAIGSDKNEGDNGTPTTLFGSYSWHCKNAGDNAKSNKNFSPDLIELCQSVLGWKIEKDRNAKGYFIKGIRLRVPEKDDHIPNHEYELIRALNPEPEPPPEPESPPEPENDLVQNHLPPPPEPQPEPPPEPEPPLENATQLEMVIANLEQCDWEEKAVIEAAGKFGIDFMSDAIIYAPIEKHHSLTEQLKKFNWECREAIATIKGVASDNLSDDELSFVKSGLKEFAQVYGDAGRKIVWGQLNETEREWLKKLLRSNS